MRPTARTHVCGPCISGGPEALEWAGLPRTGLHLPTKVLVPGPSTFPFLGTIPAQTSFTTSLASILILPLQSSVTVHP